MNKQDKGIPVSIRMTPEFKAELQRLAEEQSRSLSGQILHLIRLGLHQEKYSQTEA